MMQILPIGKVDVSKFSFPEKVQEVENVLKTLEQVEMTPLHHFFVKGAYIRELIIPAGTMLVGRRHRTEHVSIMLSGEMTVIGEEGSRRIKAPHIHVGGPGTKRVGFAHEDSKWITVHITGKTDLSEIEKEEFEDEITMFDFATGEAIANRITEARADFNKMLEETGFTEAQARQETEIEIDRMDVDLSELGLRLGNSPIEGIGVFASKAVYEDEFIGPARLDGKRTQLGRFTNHSHAPNATMRRMDDDDLYLVSLRDIEAGEEITIDYRVSVRHRIEGRKEP